MVTTISDPYNIGDYGGALSAGAGGTIANSDPYNIGIPSDVLSAGATAPNIFQQPSGFGQIIGGIGDIFGGLMGAGQQFVSSPNALMGLAGGLLTKEAYDRLSDIGAQAKSEAIGIAERGQAESQFRPFTVTTPTGAMFTARMGGQPTMPRQTMPVTSPGGFPPIDQGGLIVDDNILSNFVKRTGGAGQSPIVLGQGGTSPGQVVQPYTPAPDKPMREVLEGLMTRDVFPTSMLAPVAQAPTTPTMPAPFRPSGDPVGEFSRRGDSPIAGFPLPEAVPDIFPTALPERQGQLNQILDQLRGVTPVVSFPQTGVATQQPTAPAGEGLEIGMTLSPEEQRLQQQLLGGAGTFFGQAAQPTTSREQAIFERMRAAQRPEEERQRLALEERLAAQGRLGTSSAAYGGATPELLALSTAEREARDRSMLTAMQQAQAEQAQQAALGQQFLGAGYLPQQQLIASLQPGLIQQELAQQAQQFGTGLFGETALSGIEAQLLAEQARANLLGGIGSNVISGLINQQRAASAAPSGGSSLGGLFSTIAGGLGNIGGGIADLLGIGG